MGDGGGLDWEPIELVDSDVDQDDGPAGQVAWIDEDEVDAGGNRNDGRLPPRAARNRALASFAALSLFLAGLGASGVAAYHRHETASRLANALELANGPGSPLIQGLAALGFDSVWHAHVSEHVSFTVVNRSSGPVTVLSARISEPGLVSSSPLDPVGNGRLAPGQVGTVAGTVTADCTQVTGSQVIGLSPLGEVGGEFTTAKPVLSVVARTSGGTTRLARLDPEISSPDGLQQRICLQQGYDLLAIGRIDSAVNPATRTITLRLSADAAADATMQYSAIASYSDDPADDVTGLALSSQPLAESPVAGIVTPGGRLSLDYVIKVWSCPAAAFARSDQVEIQVDVSVKDVPLQGTLQSTDLDPLIERACGAGS